MMQVVIGLAISLAVSLAGNAWLFHERDKAIEARAAVGQLQADTKAAAGACTKSVDDLAKASRAQAKGLQAAIEGASGQVAWLQTEALKAGQVKPDNPQDLCGSLERYLKGELTRRRAK